MSIVKIMLIPIITALALVIFFLLIACIKIFIAPKKISSLERLLKNQKYKAAIKQCQAILQKNPGNWQVRYILGKAYLAENEINLALPQLTTVSKTAIFDTVENEIKFRRMLSNLLFKFQQYDKAFEELSLLLKLQPHDPDTLFKIGQIFENNNNTEKARTYYELAIQADSGYAASYAALGLLCYRAQEFEEAEKLIEQALTLDSENTTSIYYSGKIAFAKKDYAYALSAFEKASRDASLRAKCYLEKGRCYFDANNDEKAIYEFNRVISSSKNQSSKVVIFARYLMAASYERTRRLEKAVEQWLIIDKVAPGFRDVKIKLADYSEITENDSIKEYLTGSNEIFTGMAMKVVDKKLNCDIAAVQSIKNGALVTAKTRETKEWLAVRTRTYWVYFYRNDNPITVDQLQDCYDNMKKNSIDKIYVFTPLGFTQEALHFAESRPFDLNDKKKLEAMLD